MGTIYLVSTPIGNLRDISLRALDILRESSLIVAEDTRHTRKLLTHYDIGGPLTSYNEHSPPRRLEEILAAAREADVAVVTDAGTPGISDPGRELVIHARNAGLDVSVLPGPSAALTALVASGLPTEGFIFLGFLPRKEQQRLEDLRRIRNLPFTLILFEAPHRLRRTLQTLEEELGDRTLAVARELTKLHEEVRVSSVSLERGYWDKHEPRGEYTLIVAGASTDIDPPAPEDQLHEVERLVDHGTSASEAVRQVATASGGSRKVLYRRWLEHSRRQMRER